MNSNFLLFEKIKKEILSSPKEKLLCISTTSNLNNPPVFIGSIRETEAPIAGNIIIRDISVADEIITCFDGAIDYFLIDCEIKNEVKNLESIFLEKIKKSKIFIYKPNDFTVESLDILLSVIYKSLRNRKVLVIGAGNIGSKIALKICERGAEVFIYDKNFKKSSTIALGLNLIKRSDKIIKAVEQVGEVINDTDLLLGCTPGIPAINKQMMENLNKEVKIIDIGNGTIDTEAIIFAQGKNMEILSLSSLGGYIGMINNWLFQRKMFNKKRNRIIGPNDLITIGVFGKRGDIIVDDVDNPKKLIGVCDGKGDILSKTESYIILKNFFTQANDKKIAFQIEMLYAKI